MDALFFTHFSSNIHIVSDKTCKRDPPYSIHQKIQNLVRQKKLSKPTKIEMDMEYKLFTLQGANGERCTVAHPADENKPHF